MPFDKAKAEKACNFFMTLKHVKGTYAGKPFILDKWQAEDCIKPLFGTLNDKGLRKYRTVFDFMARKNGKTTKAAGVALYMLCADGERGAEVYSAAGSRKQASIAFDIAAHMVYQNKCLKKLIKVYESTKTMSINDSNHPLYGSRYMALSSDSDNIFGENSSCIIFDELHTQPNRKLWDALTTSFGARSQPLLYVLTTAGYDNKSLCYDEYLYAKAVRDGVIKVDNYLPIIYEAEEDDDWTDEAVWKKANPALGMHRSLEEMKEKFQKAQHQISQENPFRMLYLNQWVAQEFRWLSVSAWNDCKADFNYNDLKKRPCFGGLDMSHNRDITSFVTVFPGQSQGDPVDVIPYFFVPEDEMNARVQRDRVEYDVWARQGHLIVTKGNTMDHQFVLNFIEEKSKELDIKEIGYDPWSATTMAQIMQDDMGIVVVPMRQGRFTFSEPSKELDSRIAERRIRHDGNPVMEWMINNVVAEMDERENIMPSKGKSNERIDGVMALIMALARASAFRAEPQFENPYLRRGLLTIDL